MSNLNYFVPFLEICPDAIFICDLEGKILLVNQMATKLFGYPEEELIDQPIEMLLPHKVREKHVSHRKHYIVDPHRIHMGHAANIIGQHKNGQLITLDINLNPFTTENSQSHEYIIAIVRDISHIKELQSKLEQQSKNTTFLNEKLNNAIDNLNETLIELQDKNTQLKDMNLEKNQFLGIAAHDIRNPLNAILGYSKLLLSPTFGGLSEEHKYLIQRIERTSDFMLELVNDLLDITAIESGQVQLQKQTTDIERLIEDVITLERVIADQKNIQIKFLCSEILPEIHIDPSKIEQVIQNLLSNARKFSQSGTLIKVKLDREDNMAVIRVIDQGQGISEDEVELIFDPFSKSSTQATQGEKSTGLGLAIVKRIVESHEGHIKVTSTPGKGSIFSVELPI